MADNFDDVNHQLEKLLRGLKIMKIKDVIACLKEEGTWVRWNRCTRDRVLFGDDDQEVKKIGVCWVATNKVIEQALKRVLTSLFLMRIFSILRVRIWKLNWLSLLNTRKTY